MEEFWGIVFLVVLALFGIGYVINWAWPFLSVAIPVAVLWFLGYVFYMFQDTKTRNAKYRLKSREKGKQEELDELKQKIEEVKSNV